MEKTVEEISQELLREIYDRTSSLSDRDYIDVLEIIAGTLDDSVNAKKRRIRS